MEQNIRLILSSETKPTEQNLITVYNKLLSSTGEPISSDIYILLAERFFDLPKPYTKANIDRAEKIITTYSHLQEPLNQYQVRSLIVQALISNFRGQSERGMKAREFNIKAIDILQRAFKAIQEHPLYQPLALRACFVLYDIARPFFPNEERYNLQSILSIAVPLLETHLSQKFNVNLRLYIALCLLYGCILDDLSKADEASKLIQKLFTHIPTNLQQLRYSLLHIFVHFSRKSVAPLLKMKLELNEQVQKAIILYQSSASLGQTNPKDIQEAFKILCQVVDSKKDNDDTTAAEITIGEIGRYALHIGATQLANDCQARASSARSQLAKFHAALITAELNLGKQQTVDERIASITNLHHIMQQAFQQSDAVIVQDAAVALWSNTLMILDKPDLLVKPLQGAIEILTKMGCQVYPMLSQMIFVMSKVLNALGEPNRALDQLKQAASIDYYIPDHQSKLTHPFDRFLIPEMRQTSIMLDPLIQQSDPLDQAMQFLFQKNLTEDSIDMALMMVKDFSEKAKQAEADTAAYIAKIWNEIVKATMNSGSYDKAVQICLEFTEIKWDPVVYDYAIEIQCETIVMGIQAIFKSKDKNKLVCVEFVNFVVNNMRDLKKNIFPASGPVFVWNILYAKGFEELTNQNTNSPKSKGGSSTAKSGSVSLADLSDPAYQQVANVYNIRKNRLGFNAIAQFWNSYLVNSPPQQCQDVLEFVGECVTTLFDIIDFYPARQLCGHMTNYFVSIILSMCVEPPQQQQQQPNNQAKKKTPAMDPAKQKLLKQAEDTLMKAIPNVVTVSEKKSLVDRLVEVFAKRNAPPPNLSDTDFSNLSNIATIMNDKVQHKAETLAQIYTTVTDPMIQALISEKSMRLDMHQLAIDSASKTIELIPKPANRDDHYHLGLAHFCRGMTYLKLIQPSLQEFSCQDNLRRDASIDFLKSIDFFNKAKSLDNARLSLQYFCACISEGEEFPIFRMMIAPHLPDAMKLAKSVGIDDKNSVRLYHILIQAFIDQGEWKGARKAMQEAIAVLNKAVHADLWRLNLIITNKLDCEKKQSALLDEMLRVKQLGDSKYQSDLWSFVADLATDPIVQCTALEKAIDSLRQVDVMERFRANLNFAKWLRHNKADSDIVDKVIEDAQAAIADKPAAEINACKIHILALEITTTKDKEKFKDLVKQAISLANDLWMQTVQLNVVSEDDDSETKKSKMKARLSHKDKNAIQKEETPATFVDNGAASGWIQMIQGAESHKHINFQDLEEVVQELVQIIDVCSFAGYEYQMLKLWYQLFASIKTLNCPRYEHYVQLKFRLFLDRLNIVCTTPFPTDFALTEAEMHNWHEIVGRYKTDLPCKLPPLRKLLIKSAEIELEFGEYTNALYLINTAMSQAEQLNDFSTKSVCQRMLALVESRSGHFELATDLIMESSKVGKATFDFWLEWFKTSFTIGGNPQFTLHLIDSALKQLKPSSIFEQMKLDSMMKSSAQFIAPLDCSALIKTYNPDLTTCCGIDVFTSLCSRALESDNFPRDVVEFRDVGNQIREVIELTEDCYNSVCDLGEDESLPQLIRLVEAINLFGTIVVKFAPTINKYEKQGIDYDVLGSHSSLYAEFVDKTQQPLQDLSPSAAILRFSAIQNIHYIPQRLKTNMTMLLGQCIHFVAEDNVTLQNSVNHMISAVTMLIQSCEYQKAGTLAVELFDILKETDSKGAIFQFLVAQGSAAYLARMIDLEANSAPDNRELIFVHEAERLRKRFFNPSTSAMYSTSMNYFSQIKSATNAVIFNVTYDEIKNFCLQRKLTLIIIEDLGDGLEASTISFVEKEVITSRIITIDLDDVNMRYDIFKQIIATPKVDANDEAQKSVAAGNQQKGKKPVKKPNIKSIKSTSTANNIEITSSFAREAMKTNNPEFVRFIGELENSLSPIKDILPEHDNENALILSSDARVHVIPFECLDVFARYQNLFRDFSIASTIHRQNLSSATPAFNYAN